jgi:transposase
MPTRKWQAIDLENEAIEKARTSNKKFDPVLLSNDDTIKQLLARSRYFLYKNKSKWSKSQTQRASLLFELYPDIEKAYDLAQDLRNIFEKTTDKIISLSRLAKWHEKVNQSGLKLSIQSQNL